MKNDQLENQILSRLFQTARRVTLTVLEKMNMRYKLDLYIDENPYRSQSVVTKTKSRPNFGIIQSPFFSHFSLQMKLMPAMFVAFLLLAGTSFAAQGSLPGDLLYPVKTKVNEKAQSLFSFSTKNSAIVEASHAEERLTEVEKLSIANKLNSSVLLTAKADFNVEAVKVKNHIDELKAQGDIQSADEIGSDFESTLKTHHSLLVALSQKDGDIGASESSTSSTTITTQTLGQAKVKKENLLTDIAHTVDTHLKVATATRESTEQEIAASASSATPTINTKVSAETALKTAESKIVEADKSITEDTSVDQTLKTNADQKTSQAKKIVIKGQIKLYSNSYGEAFILFKSAQRKAQDSKLMLDSKDQIKTVVPAFLKIIKADDNAIDITASTTPSTTSGIIPDIKIATSTIDKNSNSGAVDLTSTTTSTDLFQSTTTFSI